VPLEHRSPQLVHVDRRRSGERITLGDRADLQIADRPAAVGERAQHFGEGDDAAHPAVVHHDERPDVVLGHALDGVHHRRVGRRREEHGALDAKNLADQHGASSAGTPASRFVQRLLPPRRAAQRDAAGAPAYL
jgi:hypothetical protein